MILYPAFFLLLCVLTLDLASKATDVSIMLEGESSLSPSFIEQN